MRDRRAAPAWLEPLGRVVAILVGVICLLGGLLLLGALVFDVQRGRPEDNPIPLALGVMIVAALGLSLWYVSIRGMLPPVGAPPPLSLGRELAAAVAGVLASFVPAGLVVGVMLTASDVRPGSVEWTVAVAVAAGVVAGDLVLGIAIALPRLSTLEERGGLLVMASGLAMGAPWLGFAAGVSVFGVLSGGLGALPSVPAQTLGYLSGRPGAALAVALLVVGMVRLQVWQHAFDDVDPVRDRRVSFRRAGVIVAVSTLVSFCLVLPLPLIAQPYTYALVRAGVLARWRRADDDTGGPTGAS